MTLPTKGDPLLRERKSGCLGSPSVVTVARKRREIGYGSGVIELSFIRVQDLAELSVLIVSTPAQRIEMVQFHGLRAWVCDRHAGVNEILGWLRPDNESERASKSSGRLGL